MIFCILHYLGTYLFPNIFYKNSYINWIITYIFVSILSWIVLLLTKALIASIKTYKMHGNFFAIFTWIPHKAGAGRRADCYQSIRRTKTQTGGRDFSKWYIPVIYINDRIAQIGSSSNPFTETLLYRHGLQLELHGPLSQKAWQMDNKSRTAASKSGNTNTINPIKSVLVK